MTIITYHEVTTRYGLTLAEVREWLEAGLFEAAPQPEAVQMTDPDELPYLARLAHDLELPPTSLHVIAGLRQRLLKLQTALARERARAAQLEHFMQGHGAVEE